MEVDVRCQRKKKYKHQSEAHTFEPINGFMKSKSADKYIFASLYVRENVYLIYHFIILLLLQKMCIST